MNVIDKVREYYEREYKDFCRLVNNPPSWYDKQQSVDNVLQRCLGIAFFVQTLDVPYKDIDTLYTEYKDKIVQYSLTN